MALKKNIHPTWYAASDLFTAAVSWMLFYFLRKRILDQEIDVDHNFWMGVFLIPLAWVVLYALIGSYNSVYKKSRLTEFTNTFICSLIGCSLLFFLLLLDDVKNDYGYYYRAFGSLFALRGLSADDWRAARAAYADFALAAPLGASGPP